MKPIFYPKVLCVIILSVFIMIACDISVPPNILLGKITLNNQPISGVTISIIPEEGGETISAVTDDQGDFFALNLLVGASTIIPSKSGFTFSPENVTLVLSSEATIENVNFVATRINPDEQIKIILTGDINLGTQVGEQVDALENGDYTFPFHYLGNYLSDADLTIGNLESIISDKGICTKKIQGVPLRANPDAVNGLNYAGFDIMSVANNHLGDYDFEGMLDSLERVNNAGIDYVGGGNNFDEAHSPVIKNVNGTKIAVLAYSNVPMYMDATGPNSPTPKWIAREDRPGLAWANDTRFETYGDLAQMTKDIVNAKAISDIVIVTVHFGWEYKYEPDDAQKEFAHTAIDAGASLVIGHHPHVQQPVEVFKGKTIAYSLGNFIFDISEERAEGTTKGMVIEAYIENRQIVEVRQVFTKINEFYQVEFDD